MKVLFDHQIFSIQQFGGISRYFTSLIRELQSAGLAEPQLPFRWTRNRHLLDAKISRAFDPVPFHFIGKITLLSHANRYFMNPALRSGKFDVFHPTLYDDYFLETLGSKPFVLTVHDLIHQRFPELPPANDPRDRHKRKLAELANRVIAVSEQTRQDLISLFGIPAQKIVTIHHAAEPRRTLEALPFPTPDRYVLFVGHRHHYKNFVRFARGLRPIMHRDSQLHLVCVGGGALKKDELQIFRAENLHDRVHWKSLNDDELATVYRQASLFVFPSLYEGFGIPILESLQNGCPAALSEASCFREVAGDAAIYFDPYNVDSMSDAIERGLNDATLRSELVSRGKKRVLDFSWRITATKTAHVYRSLV